MPISPKPRKMKPLFLGKTLSAYRDLNEIVETLCRPENCNLPKNRFADENYIAAVSWVEQLGELNILRSMGVRGLTSYIARNAERYLHPYELHDCNLVIDGDNLACNLYKDVSGCNSAFGGDYDAFYRTVIEFFLLLSECNVGAFVLMDGGYESKKLKTIEQRVRSKIGMVKHLNPLQSKPLFPLMMREVFIDATRDSGVQVMRCIFEADDELAVLARKLNCPVLSYDSDFYIHNVKYIPLVTVTLKVHIKSSREQSITRRLRHCEAKNIRKRDRLQHVQEESSIGEKRAKQKTVKYLDCCIYTIENLAGRTLNTDMLPIFAALLGNDYIDRREFKTFYAQLGFRGQNKKACKQQKRISGILKWLRHETKQSAVQKILAWMPKEVRSRLLMQLESATSGYSNERSEAFEFFGLTEEDIQLEEVEACEEDEEEVEDASDVEGENTEDENESDQESSSESSEADDDENPVKSLTESEEAENNHGDENGEISPSDCNIDTVFPDWLKTRIHNAELPRYCTDLVHLRMYINNPQVENFLFEDCNQIALKILQYIFTILNQPATPDLRYLTRVVRLTNVHYKTLQPLELEFAYDPAVIDLKSFKAIFYDLPDCEELFANINIIPSDLRLYFLAIAYWTHYTQHSTQIHLYSLIICLIVLSVIDAKVEPIRDLKKFQKRFVKILKKARLSKLKIANEQGAPITKSVTDSNRSMAEKIKFISKAECVLVMESLLKYFPLNESFKNRHNDFSSTILHGFSQFQAIFYHLSALNAVFNYPFEAIRISVCYNGMFLYNMFTNLRARLDIEYYVLNFLLQDSATMSEFYQFIVKWCTENLKQLEGNEMLKPSGKKLMKKKKIASTGIAVGQINVGEDMLETKTSSDSEFDDVNNKFSMLLKVR